MKKIPTVFKRNLEDMKHVTDEVNPVCQWVLDGEGVATRKYDGTGTMFDGTDWWSRREVKPGKQIPPEFVELDFDEVTGKRQGWEPIAQSPFYKFFALAVTAKDDWEPGTYELCGPKIQQNAENFDHYVLVKHSEAETFGTVGTPRTSAEIKEMVLVQAGDSWEGLVWHHPDGRMAKLKSRDLI